MSNLNRLQDIVENLKVEFTYHQVLLDVKTLFGELSEHRPNSREYKRIIENINKKLDIL